MTDNVFVPADRLEAFNGSAPAGVAVLVPPHGGAMRLMADGWLIELTGPAAGSAYATEPLDASGLGVANLKVEVDLSSCSAGACVPLDLELKGGSLFLIAQDSSRPNLSMRAVAKIATAGKSAAGPGGARFTRWRLVLDAVHEPIVIFART